MATSARLIVGAPTWMRSPYGLLASADIRPEPDGHWQMGITWDNICGGTGTTVADCDTSAPVVTGYPMIPPLAATTSRTIYGATPFTVYSEVDCAPVDFYENRDATMQAALAKFEDYQVERTFWTGVAMDRNNSGGFANAVLPHLAANAAVTEPLGLSASRTVTLQMAATTVTGVPLNAVDALGVLEGALVGCLGGQGMIHVPQALAPTLALLLKQQGGRLLSPNGNIVVIGGGYPGTSPAGATPANGTCWMYATGPVIGYRSPPIMRLLDEPRSAPVSKTDNTIKAIVERTYVLGYDCCLFAQLVNTASFIATTGTTP